MSIFSGNKKSSEHVLIFNIGSSSVTGAFVLNEGVNSTITATISTDIKILHDLTLSQFEREMKKSLEETMEKIFRLRMPKPNKIVVYFASPWYASQVRTAKVSRPAPFIVSKNFVNDMVSRELKSFEEEEIATHKGTNQQLRMIESKILRIKLNGYPNREPFGLSARELEISMFLSVAPEHTLSMIEEVIRHHYHSPVSFSTFLFASFLVSRDSFPHQEEYLLIDVGGEVTDVSLVQEGALTATVSFPRGRNFILRKLSAGLSRSIHEAGIICKLYTEGTVEDSVKEVCSRILNEARDQWMDSFQKSLGGISNKLSIPDTIMLSVGVDIASWFIDVIHRDEFHKFTFSEKEFKVVVLDASIFHESLSFADGVVRNPFIMIEALATNA